MKLLDRLVILAYVRSFFFCLFSLLSLYVVIDLFMNLDEFTARHHGLWPVLQHIGSYYGYRLTKFFDQLCVPVGVNFAAKTPPTLDTTPPPKFSEPAIEPVTAMLSSSSVATP